MRVVDLTHAIASDMPVFPGDPAVRIQPFARMETDGFRGSTLVLGSHAGTHMDAPYHLLAQGATLDALPAHQFAGRAFMVDCRGISPDEGIDLSHLQPLQNNIRDVQFLLFHTGWSRLWGKDSYWTGYPCLTAQAVRWVASAGLKGVGFDCPSPDPAHSAELPNHRILLEAGLVIIENLCNLAELPSAGFTFAALPLKWENADGAPVRAIGAFD